MNTTVKKLSRLEKIAFIEAHPEMTCAQLAKELNCSESNVFEIAAEYDLPIKHSRKTTMKRRVIEKKGQEGFFDMREWSKLYAF